MILVMRAQKLGEHLDRLSELVARYEQGQMDFSVLALDWLSGAEHLLREERLPEASEVLAARTSVLASKDRAQAEGLSPGGRRRAESLAALDAVCLAESILRKRQLAIDEHLDSFEAKLVEAVTALAVLGHVPSLEGVSVNAWTQQVWAALVSEQSSRPTATWLAAALSAPDRLCLLDRVLSRLRSSQLPVLVWAREQAANPQLA